MIAALKTNNFCQRVVERSTCVENNFVVGYPRSQTVTKEVHENLSSAYHEGNDVEPDDRIAGFHGGV